MASIIARAENDEIRPLLSSGPAMSNFQAYMSILKAFVGAAILAMPFAYRTSGLIGATVALVLVGLTIDFTMKYLVKIKKKIQQLRDERGGLLDLNYPEMAFEVAGPYAHHGIAASMVLSQVGACCAYVIFIGRSIDGIIDDNAQKVVGEYYVLLPLALGPFLLIITLLASENSKYLAPVALAGNVFELCTLAAVTVFAFAHNCTANDDVCGEGMNLFDAATLPVTLGIVAAAMEGIFPVLPIEHMMANPGNFNRILDFAILSAAALAAFFGVAGYTIFGVDTAATFTLNFHGGVGKAVKVGLSLALFATYPIQLYPVLQWSDQIVDDRLGSDHPRGLLYKRLTIGACVLFTVVIAMVFPYFGNTLSLIGCVGFALGGIIAPPLLFAKAFPDAQLRDKVLMGLIFLFGIFILVAGVVANIVDVVEGKAG